MVIREYFQLLFPWLFVTFLAASVSSWMNPRQFQKGWQKLAVLVISAFVALLPVQGLSLADYLLSLNPNFSLGSLALVVVLLWPQFMGRPLLSDGHLQIFCLWNVAVSLVLFSSYLGVIPFDLYALGYNFSWLFLILGLITLTAVWAWHPLSIMGIAYIAAFNLRLLPSPNFWDYITDGSLLLMSLGLLFIAWRRGDLGSNAVRRGY
jgi:hypothetical protein